MDFPKLIINDLIWGECIIDSPILIELLNSKAIQRLKCIDQAGLMHPYYPHKRYSRYDHSVGVMLLLKHYKAELPEVIMGLLHDISHTAFSHCADYFLVNEDESYKQEFQDNAFSKYLLKSDIPSILKKYGYDVSQFLDDSKYPLLERESGFLSADRLDYSLRGGISYGLASQDDIKGILSSLKINQDYWYFDSVDFGIKYKILYSMFNDQIMAGAESQEMFYRLGGVFRYLISEQYFTKDDFFKDDEFILNKLKVLALSQKEINWCYPFIMNNTDYIPAQAHSFFSEKKVKIKQRIIDPLIMDQSTCLPLSKMSLSINSCGVKDFNQLINGH